MKTLILAAIRCPLMFLVTASLCFVRPAQAYTLALKQVGSDVVANGSGAINLKGLDSSGQNGSFLGIVAGSAHVLLGLPGKGNINLDRYFGFTGPTSFGDGSFFSPNTGSGDLVGISGSGGFLLVPLGYVSGAPLSSGATFNNATFASLGVTPGTYVWTWGTGLPNQNFTLRITVPDGGTTVSMLGFGLLGLAALRRKFELLKPDSPIPP